MRIGAGGRRGERRDAGEVGRAGNDVPSMSRRDGNWNEPLSRGGNSLVADGLVPKLAWTHDQRGWKQKSHSTTVSQRWSALLW